MHFVYRGPENEPLTEVWVNKITKKVKFKNYTDDPIDRCFGLQESATYQDVMDFFERRCYPRGRADIDEILNELGLKEYDPYKMCKLFNGRYAQDQNWIDFEG